MTMNYEDGVVNELIQFEIGNEGSSPIDGFSFVVPASQVTVIYDFDNTFSSKGQVVEQLKVQNGIKLIVNFNSSLNGGETWNGRIGFRAQDFAKRSGDDYTIEIPMDDLQAIVSRKPTTIKISSDIDLRSQVFLPKGVEVQTHKRSEHERPGCRGSAGTPEKSPGTGAAYLILIIMSSFMVLRTKRPYKVFPNKMKALLKKKSQL